MLVSWSVCRSLQNFAKYLMLAQCQLYPELTIDLSHSCSHLTITVTFFTKGLTSLHRGKAKNPDSLIEK